MTCFLFAPLFRIVFFHINFFDALQIETDKCFAMHAAAAVAPQPLEFSIDVNYGI